MSFILATDTSCDVLKSELAERGIEYIPLIFTINGTIHNDDFSTDAEYKAFYDGIRKGDLPTTSQINVAENEEFYEKLIAEHEGDILYVTLSSGLSSSNASAKLAAKNVEERTGRKIFVVDSFGATIVTRHVVDEAQRLRDAGESAESAAAKLAEFAAKLHTWFMPVDLMHLKRGGRVSGPMAYLGTALNIKPIIRFNETGGLTVVKKVRGAAKGIAEMAEAVKRDSAKTPHKIYIASADSDLAEELLERVKAARPDCEAEIGWIGPVIGAHTGCGAVGVSFVSDSPRKLK